MYIKEKKKLLKKEHIEDRKLELIKKLITCLHVDFKYHIKTDTNAQI